MSGGLPKYFLLLEIKDIQIAAKISEGKAEIGGGTGCKGTGFDAFRVVDS
jgi:hypothetical protein